MIWGDTFLPKAWQLLILLIKSKMESNNCYYSYSYSYFFNFHAELSTLENLEMLDLGSNGLNFSQKMQGKERERERERERYF